MLTPIQQPLGESLLSAVENVASSPETRRWLTRRLRAFFDWVDGTGAGFDRTGTGFDRTTVMAYRAKLLADGAGAGVVNQSMTAIRSLAREARDQGALDLHRAQAIISVPGVRQLGVRAGNWLVLEEAQRLIDAPDPEKNNGARDRAILALLLGCGVRRGEAAGLTVDRLQSRDGRWVLLDILGKHGRVRTVPMPMWAHARVTAWLERAEITEGRALRAVNKGDRIYGEGMSASGIWWVVKHWARELELSIAPHDLRRSFAKLARKGGADLVKVQHALGHASVQTTERYVGAELDLDDPACDALGVMT
jgi:site-specific recombinase XerD